MEQALLQQVWTSSFTPLTYCDECTKLMHKLTIYCPHCGGSSCSMGCHVRHLCRHAEDGPLESVPE
jgi:hypothetical protein